MAATATTTEGKQLCTLNSDTPSTRQGLDWTGLWHSANQISAVEEVRALVVIRFARLVQRTAARGRSGRVRPRSLPAQVILPTPVLRRRPALARSSRSPAAQPSAATGLLLRRHNRRAGVGLVVHRRRLVVVRRWGLGVPGGQQLFLPLLLPPPLPLQPLLLLVVELELVSFGEAGVAPTPQDPHATGGQRFRRVRRRLRPLEFAAVVSAAVVREHRAAAEAATGGRVATGSEEVRRTVLVVVVVVVVVVVLLVVMLVLWSRPACALASAAGLAQVVQPRPFVDRRVSAGPPESLLRAANRKGGA